MFSRSKSSLLCVMDAYQSEHFFLLFADVEVDRGFFEQLEVFAGGFEVCLVSHEFLLDVDGPV
jgi:hypothetical protein